MAELHFDDAAAAGYDRLTGPVSRHFIPFLLRAGHIGLGMRVLDVATGTGLAAEAALASVGPSGSVVAADISHAMVERARERLGAAPNVIVAVEDRQSLTFANDSFDAVLCSLGLMFFPNPARGLSEFHRVLRPGGRAAVSVNTVPERSFTNRINIAIGRHAPSLAEAAARVFSLGDEARLRSLFEEAGFGDIEVATEVHPFGAPSFEAYFGPIEQGASSAGQAYVALPEEVRGVVREEVRRDLRDNGGPIEIEVEIRFASGRR
jgi:ubiquinone/menaquinone biosynthesis C-methylase UbiE